ncbi:mannosylglucosyl-3-phosphoglycerate phosphatase-like isoform X1 [Daphnia carinata]|uniref:mannosylglucosyl-3-phosphoglycerate phosphatase-like isoform X1 n=2 Tax=Daphnia carinata TaxID=120202 RepID=UPI00257CE69E|nr:mannosylglucosyl-3-phosphoglycerate phosphatase-like isoform X1 [Daphnia carinata]
MCQPIEDTEISGNMAPTAAHLPGEKTLTILHFNDVYNIESVDKEPVGGAARFSTALKSFSHLHPLILFSGDVFAPSFMSTFTKGEQMVPVLNACGIQCAVYGNHDFDFGIDVLMQRAQATTFPWLMSNVIDNETRRPLADGKVSLVIDWHGIRIGLIGLVEKEWLDTLAAVDPEHVTYTDYAECGRLLARNLKDIQGCKIVIALTHMRTPNDIRLAKEVDEIDLILGGHDHVSEFIEVENRCIIKSGTDFRQFSEVTMRFLGEEDKPLIGVRLVDVTSEYDEDVELKLALDSFTSVIGEKMEEVLGEFSVPLDGLFSSIRTSETNLGNFICDVMVAATDSDLALLNSGTLRSDRIHPPGPFKIRDLSQILPMLDPLIVVEISGEDLLAALENGVCMYPKLEGRFLQVGGMSFAFDPTKPPLQRVDPRFVRVGDQYLNLQTKYRMVTKAYMMAGKDGFDVLKKLKILVDEEDSLPLNCAVQNHFQAIQKLCSKTKRPSHHRQSLVTLSRRHSLARTIDHELHPESTVCDTSISECGSCRLRKASTVEPANVALLFEENVTAEAVQPTTKQRAPKLQRQSSMEEMEKASCKLMPRIEGRIVIINDETLPQLLSDRQLWDVHAVHTIRESSEN